MFALFYNLYFSMFIGQWFSFDYEMIEQYLGANLNAIGEFLTSIFNNVDNPMDNLGDKLVLMNQYGDLHLIAFILATITTIGIVVVATKGIKKLFTVFFYGVR